MSTTTRTFTEPTTFGHPALAEVSAEVLDAGAAILERMIWKGEDVGHLLADLEFTAGLPEEYMWEVYGDELKWDFDQEAGLL